MAISFVGAGGASGTSVTVPAGHQAGDLLVVWAYRQAASGAPSIPAGWTSVYSGSAAGSALRVGYKIATSNSEVSGTWTSATICNIAVYRGAREVGTIANGTGSSASIIYPAATFAELGDSWSLRMAAHNNNVSLTTTTPSGYTNRFATASGSPRGRVIDSNGTVASNPTSASQGVTTSGVWRAQTIEILMSDVKEGQASGSYTWSSAATGKRNQNGTTSGAYGWAGTATGKSTRSATAGTSNYLWTASAVGKETPKSSTSGDFTWSTGSVGEAQYEGEAAGAYTFATDAATGDTPSSSPRTSGQYFWDSLARGRSYRSATAGGAYTWAATATGKRLAKASASVGNFTFAVAGATGARTQKGQTSGAYQFAQGDSIGYRPGSAFAAGGYRWVALATGLFVPKPVAGTVGWYAE